MEIMNAFKELLKEKGFRVDIDSGYCKTFKSTHDNCNGCESKEGCGRFCALAIVNLTSSIYEPKDFNDFEKMNKSIKSKMNKILDKDVTEEEIKSLF